MKHPIHLLQTLLLCLCLCVPTTLWGQEKSEAGKVDVSSLIFGHIGDSYEWHFTNIGETHVSLYLPVIIHSRQSGWHCFSSRHFHHGNEAYEGLYIAHGGDHDGKVVERDAVTGEEFRPTDLSLTKNALALLINSALLIAMVLYCSRWYRRHRVEDAAPRGFVGLIEMMVQMIYVDVIKGNIPQHVQRYAPYLLTAFFFIFLNNLIGLIPGSANLTGNIAITFVLALCTFLMINLFGNKEYWKDILSPDVPGWLKPIMAIIEIFGLFTKPIALMIRLFANIMAGHTAMLALFSVIFITASMGPVLNGSMSFLSIVFCIFMNCLELLVAFIQAYVFTMLSAVFIGLSQPLHHAAEPLPQQK
jgi:F-type H+-transporting ATPase subunit a